MARVKLVGNVFGLLVKGCYDVRGNRNWEMEAGNTETHLPFFFFSSLLILSHKHTERDMLVGNRLVDEE